MSVQFTVFANTGVQYYNTGEKSDTVAFNDWTHTKDNNGKPILWLMYRSIDEQLVLCVDTTLGDLREGCVAEDESCIPSPAAKLELPTDDGPYVCEVVILPSNAGVGEPIDTALVLDFGNCRGLALLLDKEPGADFKPSLMRFNDMTEHALSQSLGDEVLENSLLPEAFSTKLELVEEEMEPKEVRWVEEVTKTKTVVDSGMFGRKTEREEEYTEEKEWVIASRMFPQFSPVRMGDEAHNLAGRTLNTPFAVTGMSSPKRYLWDDRPLAGYFWQQLRDIDSDSLSIEPAQGRYYEFLYDDDRDWEELPINESTGGPLAAHPSPTYPRQSMLTACIYEILTKVYQHINSVRYTMEAGVGNRKRNLTDLVMSFPSGMSQEELARYKIQVMKAIRIFSCTHLHLDGAAINLHMEIDEGIAGQLAYVFGEIDTLGSAEKWISVVGREGKVRIANIDIGGGTSDLLIADYSDSQPGPSTDLLCEVVHKDGLSKGGDDLIKALIEEYIIPEFCAQLSLSRKEAAQLFEIPGPGNLKKNRRYWFSNFFEPLAVEYLSRANSSDTDVVISPQEVSSLNIADLAEWIEKTIGRDVPLDSVSTEFRFDNTELARLFKVTFFSILYQYASVIASADCDMVILSGRTSSLKVLPEVMKQLLPFTTTRILSLAGYDTGTWYPIQNKESPGSISDPKSVVAVGAAIQFLACAGVGLGSFRQQVRFSDSYRPTYYWGVASARMPNFSNKDAVFAPRASDDTEDEVTVRLIGRENIIARRMTADQRMEAAPIYCLEVDSDFAHQGVDVTLKRLVVDGDERLELLSVSGMFGHEQAVVGENVNLRLRTMYPSVYFLDDTPNINYDKIAE